ncbi:hypothetical protein CH64_1890 [Yersinia rohdei]|uniref:Type VI secretion protein n=1 Tax=Yersinia rohdei TaxID=29485 RepID=A0ABN4EVZ1_YERRO|nr:hypothetical protein [Yersinia rohdei]AJJ09059.1 hypothetical protein CH64_1890 [Yersinia rohdei]EEQ02315.1 hypothetical protein yrohd0001_18030 [Yersinia rohdei ATCC 43380]
MSVELRKIPEPEALPEPLVKIRWAIFIILCIFMGFFLTLYFWPKDLSTHTFWFWMCSLFIPSSIGVISYALRLRHYEQQWERVSYWNQLHREKQQEMVLQGQKALGLLGMAYVTPAANNKLASALLKGAAPLQTLYPPGSTSVLMMSSLQPPARVGSEAEYCTRLETHLKSVLQGLDTELKEYAVGESIIVRIRHDATLEDAQILSIWQRIFPEDYAISKVIFGQQDNGLMWLDNWLDEQNSALVLSLEMNLFVEGRDYQTESVSALLLASPAWLIHQNTIPIAWIHRPVAITATKEALEDVIRWGMLSVEERYFIWRSQLPTLPQTEMLQAMDAMNYHVDKDSEHQLDSSLGKPAVAVGHITLICACDHAVSSQQPQWIMLQDETPQWVIVRPA